MYYLRKSSVILILIFLFIITGTVATAEKINVDMPSLVGISIALVASIVAIIIAVITTGGIKYVTPDNVLDTEVRKNLYEYIDEYPGSHLREIARELNLKQSNAAWHLRKL